MMLDKLAPLTPAELRFEAGTDSQGRAGSAVFDPQQHYRYELRRGWHPEGREPRTMVVCGCNPSFAGAAVNDQTINRCCYFAKREGCNRLIMVNVAAMISTDPRRLAAVMNPVGGPLCDAYIRQAVTLPGALVVLAWGNVPRLLEARADEVTAMVMQAAGASPPVNFGLTRKGHPKHPCRLGNKARLSHDW